MSISWHSAIPFLPFSGTLPTSLSIQLCLFSRFHAASVQKEEVACTLWSGVNINFHHGKARHCGGEEFVAGNTYCSGHLQERSKKWDTAFAPWVKWILRESVQGALLERKRTFESQLLHSKKKENLLQSHAWNDGVKKVQSNFGREDKKKACLFFSLDEVYRQLSLSVWDKAREEIIIITAYWYFCRHAQSFPTLLQQSYGL